MPFNKMNKPKKGLLKEHSLHSYNFHQSYTNTPVDQSVFHFKCMKRLLVFSNVPISTSAFLSFWSLVHIWNYDKIRNQFTYFIL